MKKIIFLIFFLIITINFISLDQKKKIGLLLKDYLPDSFYSVLLMVFDYERNSKRISNDYNIKFLPNTQFLDLSFKKNKLDFLSSVQGGYLEEKKGDWKTFFIEISQDKIFFLDSKANLHFVSINDFLKKNYNYSKIETNLTSDKRSIFEKILDFEIFENSIYVSKSIIKDNCHYLLVDKARLNLNYIEFEKIFSSEDNNECIKYNIQAGKLELINDKELLLTTGGDIWSKGNMQNEIDKKPQDNDSVFGKVLLIDTRNYNFKIFNKGHRNSLGLLVDEGLIISTENGPRGGDEINIETLDSNYGWDIASYGEKYNFNENYLDHNKAGFKEPIFSFIPSIGITEIIKLENNFNDKWNDNYLIGSLYDRHMYRIKLNKSKNGILFYERIFIGERIRDLEYDNNSKTIFLALEESGSVGYLQN